MTEGMVPTVGGLPRGGASYRMIITAAGVSMGSVHLALTGGDAQVGADVGES